MTKKMGFWLGLASLVFLFSGLARAQVTTGTISGTVEDSSGAVIPGAAVTVRNVQTGISRTLSMNAQGYYTAPQLGLGMYEVTAEAPGFQSVVRSGIEMTVGRQAVVDLTLQVGAVAERITVTGEAPLLETTNATVSGLVTETQMRDLPLLGRSFTDLAAIQPGVVTDMDIPQSTIKGGGRVSMGGARPQQSLYMLDGIEISDPVQNTPPVGVMGQTLGVDTIREFTVLSNNYGAQYGRAIGGIVNAVTRSGTNELHGGLFNFFRNEKLDAKNYFDLPNKPIPPFKRNQFGGTLGGPIVRDNTFFFASYEGLRQILSTTDFGSALTDEARAGRITNCPIDPATGLRWRTCTKEEAEITEVLPLGIHPDIKPFLNLIPRANGIYLNDGIQDLRGSRQQRGRENYYMFRIDQRLSDNDNLFGRMVMDSSSKELPDAQFFDVSKNKHTTNNEWGAYNFVMLEWVRILSPSVLNALRIGFTRNHNNQCQCVEGEDKHTTAADIPGSPPQFEIIPGVPWGGPWGIPGVSIPGHQNGPGRNGNGAYTAAPLKFANNTFTYYDSVRVLMGRHSLDFGVDIRRYQENMLRTTSTHGGTSWHPQLKNFLTAGQPGYCTGPAVDCRGINTITAVHTLTPEGGFARADVYRGFRQTYTSWYVQDDFQLLRNLTVNLGVRWEKLTPPVEVNGKAAQLPDILRDSKYTQLGKKPLFHLRDIFGGLMPRFGFAYSPDKKTSIRGGFGLFKEMPLLYQWTMAIFHPPQANRVVVRNTKQWPQPLKGIDPTSGNLAPSIVNYDYKYPSGMQWNFGIERQIGQLWVARATYIGTRNVNLTALINHVQPALSVDANGVLFTPLNAPSINPAMDSTNTFANIGDSWYNALQLRIQKRFSQGLEFSASHTWSKSLSDVGLGLTSGEGPESFGGGGTVSNLWDYKGFDKGRWDNDARHIFNFNFTYELPVGQGRAFGTNMGSVANAILGGWQTNGLFTTRSGLPLNISGPGYNTNTYCRCVVRPNLKPGGNNNAVIGQPDHWFDETQFELVQPGYFGNVGKSTMGGPGLTKMDFSVFKRFAVGEGKSLQFRAEFFNLQNHPNFAGPNTLVFDTNGRRVDNPGRITKTVATPRQVQLALKFEF